MLDGFFSFVDALYLFEAIDVDVFVHMKVFESLLFCLLSVCDCAVFW